MSDWIDRRIMEVKANKEIFPNAFDSVDREEKLVLLEALKQAEEALQMAERELSDRHATFIVRDALATIAALGKDHSPEAGQMVSGKGE